MGLFNKSRGIDLSPILTDEEAETESPVNYSSVLDYLIGLSRSDYDKLYKVSTIYRVANKDAAKVLGVKDEPTTALKDEEDAPAPQPEAADDSDEEKALDDFLADDDELGEFLEDISPKDKAKK